MSEHRSSEAKHPPRAELLEGDLRSAIARWETDGGACSGSSQVDATAGSSRLAAVRAGKNRRKICAVGFPRIV
jgi:hypothetical protein